MAWNKESIQELLEKNDRAVVRALLAIYERQTDSEKVAFATTLHNGVGFTAFDAARLTDIAKMFQRTGRMSPKTIAFVRRRIKKYWRQLMEIANAQPPKEAV